jgi:hypothetical protein
MANLTLYSNAYVTVEGKLLTQESSVSVEKKSGLNPVYTVAEGLAGMSQGASTAEISIDNAVPSADFEFNPDAFMRTGAVVEIGVIMAGRQSVFKGFITDATYSHSVNDASKLSMKLLCRFSDFE